MGSDAEKLGNFLPREADSLLSPHLLRGRSELESFSRQNAQTAYMGDNTLLCRVLGKYSMYTDTRDIGLTPHLALDGHWEAWVTLAMARLIKPDMRCIDVGANYGYYSVLMGDGVGSDGLVVALEPNPHVASLLKSTLHVNGLTDRVTVLEKAAYHVDEEDVNFVLSQDFPMNGNIGISAPNDESLTVKTVTLDTLTRDWDRVDFVKIDAEGAEWGIWQGMSDTIDRNPDITVIMEFNPSRHYDPEVFFDRIEAKGFSLQHIDFDSNIVPAERAEIINSPKDWMLFLHRVQE